MIVALALCAAVAASQPLAPSPVQTYALASSTIAVNVSVSASATTVSGLSASLAPVGQAGHWTPNLLAANLSMTSTAVGNVTLGAAGGSVVSSNATTVVVEGVRVGALATETWVLTVDGSTFTWDVSRTYGVAANVTGLAFPRLVVQTSTGAYMEDDPHASTGDDWRNRVQMPSFLSMDDLLNPATNGAWNVSDGWVAQIGSSSPWHQHVLLSPAALDLDVASTAPGCRFSFSRRLASIVDSVGIGAECAAGPSGAVSVAAGDTASNSLSFTLRRAAGGIANFSLTIPANPEVASFATTFATVYNTWSGWIYGNSPASETCVHELSVFPQLQSLYAAAPPPGVSVHAAMGKFLTFMYDTQVNATGWVYARWSMATGSMHPNPHMGIIDQFPHAVLAAWFHAVNTGDKATVRAWVPALTRAMDFMMGPMQLNATSGAGVLTNPLPYCQGRANMSCADNWLDDIRFGHQDSIVAAYAVRAVEAFADLLEWLGDAAAAAPYKAMHPRLVAAFNKAFWDADAGFYRDWVDVNGVGREYFYTWQQFVAIEFGIASQAQAASIMAATARLRGGVESKYGVDLWCTPTNLIPAEPSDITLDFDGEYTYGHYENGCCFFWHSGLEMLATGRVHGGGAAFEFFEGMAPRFNGTRFWSQRFSWLQGQQLGLDVITDGLVSLYGGVFGSFGVRPTLSNGYEVVSSPAPELEGAVFHTVHLGLPTALTVTNGKVVVSSGGV